MPRLTYREQLQHPMWQRRRLERMAQAYYRCELCDDDQTMLNVHHKRYVKGRDVWDYSDDELVVYCKNCHEDESEEAIQFSALIAKLPIDGPLSVNDYRSLVAGWASFGFYDEAMPFADRDWAFLLGRVAGAIDLASNQPGKRVITKLDLEALALCFLHPELFIPRLKAALRATLEEGAERARANREHAEPIDGPT